MTQTDIITLFSSGKTSTDIGEALPLNPIIKWLIGITIPAVISWGSWTTNEILAAKSAAGDVRSAIERLDTRFIAIDHRLERIELMLMEQGVNNGRRR